MKSQGQKPARKLATIIDISHLPDAPGVYFFIGQNNEILYIGRATSLRDRVKSYFADDVIQMRGPLIVDMVFHSTKIDFVQTDSVLEAIIQEANVIKKYQPRYNTKEKSDKSFNYIVITKEEFPRVLIARGKDVVTNGATEYRTVFGPYTQSSTLRDGLKIIRKIFPFRDRCVPNSGRPCFNRQLGLCPGVCTGEISAQEYGFTIKHLEQFLGGEKDNLLKDLEKEMIQCAKEQRFEQAGVIKKTLFALTHIQDIALVKDDADRDFGKDGLLNPESTPETIFRIEAYDVAHTSGKNTVGVMTVLEDRQLKKSEYRMFKVKNGNDDVGSLEEVLRRRLDHPEWSYPNLIVLDGSKAQKNAADRILAELSFDIATVSVIKNDKHKPDRILGDKELVKKYSKEILLTNAEAHRFAIKYHRRLRGGIKGGIKLRARAKRV